MGTSIDIHLFLKLYSDFVSLPTYTLTKRKNKKQLDDYLSERESTIINVKVTSKYNYCNRSYSFTIYNVPCNQMGKLYSFRGSQVLIICKSYGPKGWGKYWNEVYRLSDMVDDEMKYELKKEFQENFVLRL
jgi:hypothetical protein